MTNDPFTGRILGGKYRLLRRLGEGGMGSIYEAVHQELDKPVAVKLLHQKMAEHQELYQRFRREARIACRLSHPNIIEVHDFDRTPDDIPYIVMELLKGQDLEQHLEKERRLSIEQTLSIFSGVFKAVQHAHDLGVVHRDLKPSNIFLCRLGAEELVPKVLDFGISKLGGQASLVTQANAIFGSPYFMSPEQARGKAADADPRSDIFSLGVMLYVTLCGELPFQGHSIEAILYQVVHEDPEPLTRRGPELTPAVAEAVHRALAKDPEARFQAVRDLATALQQAARGPAEPRLDVVDPRVSLAGSETIIPLDRPRRSDRPSGENPGFDGFALMQGRGEREPPVRDLARPSPGRSGADRASGPGFNTTLSSGTGQFTEAVQHAWIRWLRPSRLVPLLLLVGGVGLGVFYLRAGPGGAERVATGDASTPLASAGVMRAARAEAGPGKQAQDGSGALSGTLDRGLPDPPLPTVAITLKGLPDRAVVRWQGIRISGNPIYIKRSIAEGILEVDGASGPFRRTLVPDQDQVVVVAFARSRPPRGHASPGRDPAGPASTGKPGPQGGRPDEPASGPGTPALKEYRESTMPLEL